MVFTMIRQNHFVTVADGKLYRMMDLGEHVAHWTKTGLTHRQAAMNFFAVQSVPWALTDKRGRNSSDRVGVLIDEEIDRVVEGKRKVMRMSDYGKCRDGGHAEGQAGRSNWQGCAQAKSNEDSNSDDDTQRLTQGQSSHGNNSCDDIQQST